MAGARRAAVALPCKCFVLQLNKISTIQNQIKSRFIYIAPYVHEDSEALGGWITCSRRVGIGEFLNVF